MLATSKSGENVVIVEDEESLAELFAYRLEDEYNTTIAPHAGDAIANITNETDFVLLDRRLPGMSGDKILEYINDEPITVNVIIISAIDPCEKVIHEPYDEYITKSVNNGEIKNAIQRVKLKNKFIKLFTEYVRKGEQAEILQSELNLTEQDENIDLQIIEDELKRMADEFNTVANKLADSKATDILCNTNMDDLNC